MSNFSFLGLAKKMFQIKTIVETANPYFSRYGVKVRGGTGGAAKPVYPVPFGGVHHPLGGVPKGTGTAARPANGPKKSFF